jgi:predicted helicase
MPPKAPKYINSYYDTLHEIEMHGALTEGAVRIAFQNVLTEAAKKHHFTVLAEQHIELEGKRKIRVDGEIRDQYKLRRGIWEAKDTSDNLDTEIKKKLATGYPRHNTIFENTKRAVLFQNGEIVLDTDITKAANLEQLLHQFLAYTQPQIESFHHAVTEFKRQIPKLGESLAQIIQKAKRDNKTFKASLETFWELCKSSLNPSTKLEEVEDMLAQHLLTERIFRSVFNNPDFVTRNAIARELEKVVTALTSRSFSRADFLSNLDPCVGTGTFMLELMERIGNSNLPHKYAHELHCNEVLLLPYYIAAQNIEHEYFERTGEYKAFDGIVFADTLDMKRVQADMFAPENTERIAAQEKTEIFAIIGNPPYNVGQENENDNNKNRKYPTVDDQIRTKYIRGSRATLHTKLYDMYVRFYRWATDRLGERDGVICFVTNNSFLDQLAFDQMRKKLLEEFTSIYVLDLGGNVRQNPKLSGTTHNVFGIQVGVIVTLLIRNRTANPESERAALHYARVDEFWRKEEKYKFLEKTEDLDGLTWEKLEPNLKGVWLLDNKTKSYDNFLAIGSKDAKSDVSGAENVIFKIYSLGVATNRDDWVYDFSVQNLKDKLNLFIEFYNLEVSRWQRNKNNLVSLDDFLKIDEKKIKWSESLKQELRRINYAEMNLEKITESHYRPFTHQFLFLDKTLNDRVGLQPKIFPIGRKKFENLALCVSGSGSERPFASLVSHKTPDLNFFGPGTVPQWFPFYIYNEDGSHRRENITDWALEQYQNKYGKEITKWDVFHSIYGLLHSPEYRSKYAANLKRELPRIPLVTPAAFKGFLEAGRALAKLHVEYETAPEYKLKHLENRDVPWTWVVTKMKLSKDKTQLVVNDALTLTGIPPEVFEYKLGNRSALEWIVDQYQISTDKRSGIVTDPNNPDDPEYIVRLVKKVVTISLETVRVVRGLPNLEVDA